MALTRPSFTQLTTTTTAFNDPITVLNQGSASANVDVGFLFNRANGLVSNVALYWSEATQSFVTAYTTATGTTNANVAATSFANIRTGNITANGFFWSNGTVFSSGSTFTGGYVQNTIIAAANLVANSGTASSSNVTGAVVVSGGIGVSGSVNVGSSLVFSNTSNPGISKPLATRLDLNNAGGLDSTGYGSFWSGYHFSPPDGIVVNGLTGYPRMAFYWNYNSVTNPNNIHFNMVVGNNATGGNANVSLGTDTAGYVRFLTNNTERLKIGGEGNVVATATTTSTSTTTGALVIAGGVGIAGNIVTAGTANKFTGCVAIGSSNPTHKLQISADGYNTRISDSTNGYGYNIGRSTTDGLLYFYGDQTVYTGYVFSGVDGERVKISASGNLVINATETSSTTTSGALVVKGGVGVAGTMTVGGTITGKTNTGGNVAASNDSGTLSIRGSTTNAAVISFHRTSLYAINMGLDTDNTFKIGGWSDGASTYRLQVTSAGALTLTGGITATGATLTGTIIASTVNAGTIGNSGATLTGTVSTAAQNSITTMTGLTGFGTASVVTTAAGHLTVTGNLTVNGTQNIINNTIYETTEYVVTQNATFGNVSNSLYAGSLNTANAVITGGYINSLANLTATTAHATNFSSGNIVFTNATSGTVSTANISLYESVTATTTNSTHYPMLSGTATGNTASFTSSSLVYNPSTGNLVVAGTTASTSTTTGALVVKGGVGIAGNLNTGSTSINALLVGGTTSQLQINGDVTIAGANGSVLGNMFYQGGWKYAANGAAWGFREDNTGNLQVIAAPVNSSGALAAASPTYPITLNLTTGNLGIGTSMTSPDALLHVKDGTNPIYFEPTGNWAGKIFNATDAPNEHGLVVGSRWAAAASTAFEVGSPYGGGAGSWRSYFKIDGAGGLTMSSGGLERVVMNSTTGNVVITATTTSTSTTTGAMVVKGGAGIAGQVTAGNIMTTSGVYWANGAAYSSGGSFTGGYVASQSTFGANLVANSATNSTSNVTGAVVVAGAGGLGVGGNVYVGNRVGYVWAANSVSSAYTYFNSTTNSIDTVFGL